MQHGGMSIGNVVARLDGKTKPAGQGEQDELLRGLQEGNTLLQQEQKNNLKNDYQRNKQGVQAKEAF